MVFFPNPASQIRGRLRTVASWTASSTTRHAVFPQILPPKSDLNPFYQCSFVSDERILFKTSHWSWTLQVRLRYRVLHWEHDGSSKYHTTNFRPACSSYFVYLTSVRRSIVWWGSVWGPLPRRSCGSITTRIKSMSRWDPSRRLSSTRRTLNRISTWKTRWERRGF